MASDGGAEQIGNVNALWRELVLSARQVEAPRRALADTQAALEQLSDALRQLATDEARFAGADPRHSVPLQQELQALSAAVDREVMRSREAASALEAMTALREHNVEQFRYWTIENVISRRLPEEMNARTPLPPLPRVDLSNPALGRAANNVGDDAPLNETLAGISLFG